MVQGAFGQLFGPFWLPEPLQWGQRPVPLHEPQGLPANVPDPLHMLQRPDAC